VEHDDKLASTISFQTDLLKEDMVLKKQGWIEKEAIFPMMMGWKAAFCVCVCQLSWRLRGSTFGILGSRTDDYVWFGVWGNELPGGGTLAVVRFRCQLSGTGIVTR
jgi:hypothetical protein